jgi:hypothetical protein
MKEVVVNSMTFGQRVILNLFCYSMLLLCIYVSEGSAWWTLVTGVIFISCLVGQAKRISTDYTLKLKSKADAIAWANSLPDDK